VNIPVDTDLRLSSDGGILLLIMENPYFALHQEFRDAGAEVLISSGQACVAFGIATFSKDGDWIIRDNEASCNAVLSVLGKHGAMYRLGAPLHPGWLCLGWTSHFEFRAHVGLRMRTDFCSRPPRVPLVDNLWSRAVKAAGLDVVDVESLIRLKQTRRQRDYSIIGALAEVAGWEEDMPELALQYLQDYDGLLRAVQRWPAEAAACEREAVRRLRDDAPRAEVVAAIAVEQDARIQEDQARIAAMQAKFEEYASQFGKLRSRWRRTGTPLPEQHRELVIEAESLRKGVL
jgi:hypothetical protein